MAGKKAKSDIDAVRGELTELTEAVYALRDLVRVESAAAAAANGAGGKSTRVAPVGKAASSSGGDGITLQGEVHLGGDLAASWSTGTTVEALLAQDGDDLARVLAAIGHRQRLAIVQAMLAGPKTAAELGSTLGLGTSGAVYHHLNVLTAAGLVRQTTRGIFAVAPERIGMLLSVLASSFVQTTVVASETQAAAAE